MDERTIDRTQSWISDTEAMGLYSTLLHEAEEMFGKGRCGLPRAPQPNKPARSMI
jgi:hypothetical protein